MSYSCIGQARVFVFGGMSYSSNYSLPSVSSHLYSYSVNDGSWREETVNSRVATLPDSSSVQLPVFVAGCSAHYDARSDRLVILFGYSASTSTASSGVRDLVQTMNVTDGSWALLVPNSGTLPALYRHASVLSSDASSIYVWGGFKPVATAAASTSAFNSTSRLALSSSVYSLSLTSLTWYSRGSDIHSDETTAIHISHLLPHTLAYIYISIKSEIEYIINTHF